MFTIKDDRGRVIGAKWGRVILAVVLLFVLLLGSCTAATGVSQNKAEATRWGCVYGGGLLDTPNLKKTVAPGTRGGFTVYDTFRTIPSDVRDYIIDANTTAADPGAVPIVLPVKARDVRIEGEEVLSESEGVTYVLLELQAKFVFNENACLWDKTYGRGMNNLGFDTPQGEPSDWTVWLKNNTYKRIQEAARPIVKDFDWLELSTNQEVVYDGQDADEVFDILAREISATLTTELEASLGGNFFCGPSYAFDGDVDGELESCPAIEISITELTPQNPELIKNYEAIVANAEAQQKIESDKDRAIAQANAASEQQQEEAKAASAAAVTAATESQKAQIAEENRRKEVGTSKAAADLTIAQAQAEVARQQAINDGLIAEGTASFCRELAAVGQSCIMLEAAKQGTPVVPQIVTGDAGTLLNIPS